MSSAAQIRALVDDAKAYALQRDNSRFPARFALVSAKRFPEFKTGAFAAECVNAHPLTLAISCDVMKVVKVISKSRGCIAAEWLLDHPNESVASVARIFGLTRQCVHRALKDLHSSMSADRGGI